MVFEWLRGSPYKKFVKRLQGLTEFAETAAKDMTTGDLTQALTNFQVSQVLLKDLLASFEQNRAAYFEMNRDASAKIVELVYKLQAVIQEAITRTAAMKQAVRKGRYPSSQAGLMARNGEAVREIQDMIARVQAYASMLRGKKSQAASAQSLPYLLRKYNYVTIIESPQFVKDKRKYAAYRDNIEALQRKIVEAPEFLTHVHEIENRRGRLQGLRHARLTKNIRLFYGVNRKTRTLVWWTIITHTEYEQSVDE